MKHSKQYKNSLIEMIKSIKPTHFITIQIPCSMKTELDIIFTQYMYLLMKVFEKALLGRHWNKYVYKFFMIYERGAGKKLHAHILVNLGSESDERIINAGKQMWHAFKCQYGTRHKPDIDIEEIISQDKVADYCLKELWKGSTRNMTNSDNIFTESMLFHTQDIDHKERLIKTLSSKYSVEPL